MDSNIVSVVMQNMLVNGERHMEAELDFCLRKQEKEQSQGHTSTPMLNEETSKKDLVKCAVIQKFTATTMIIPSHFKSDGFANRITRSFIGESKLLSVTDNP